MHANVLLLQGPIGPFFSRLASELTERGFNVWKVNLNGGDRLFYNKDQSIDYSGNLKDWDSYLDRLVVNKSIGRIYLYGDCRAYHRIARKIAKRRGIRVFVFEEGYIRPNYITLEEHGVNGHSPMLHRKLEFSDLPEASSEDSEVNENVLPKKTFNRSAFYSIAYYIACQLGRKRFSEYQHHRSMKAISEGARWIRSGIRKVRFQRSEKDILQEVIAEYDNNYFVCPLQVHCDMQVVVHSKYNSIEHFIGDVLTSFARHAASNKAIVFKHHPMDRAYKDYTVLFENLVGELGLQGRVFYVHDVCLPTLLKHAEGTVLINSTVGMSSLFHGTPVKTMGKAIYDRAGLTAQRSLESFWGRPGAVHKISVTGLSWSNVLTDEHRYSPERFDDIKPPTLRVVGGRDVEIVLEDNNKKAA